MNVSHNWTAAGVYRVKVYAQDFKNKTSNATEILIFIDVNVIFIDDIISGYLIDYEKTGTYEAFFNNATNNEISVEKKQDGGYLIDVDGDGTWEYSYDLVTGLKTLKQEDEDNRGIPGFEFVPFLFIISLVILFSRKNRKIT